MLFFFFLRVKNTAFNGKEVYKYVIIHNRYFSNNISISYRRFRNGNYSIPIVRFHCSNCYVDQRRKRNM